MRRYVTLALILALTLTTGCATLPFDDLADSLSADVPEGADTYHDWEEDA